ncbi:Two-component response regulator-like [Orobanche gracilis]
MRRRTSVRVTSSPLYRIWLGVSISMKADANGENKSPHEDKDIEDGVLGERRSSVRVGKSKADAGSQGVKHVASIRFQGSGILQVQQQTAQGSVVYWERFLHVRSVHVLLVENDDSTRHVVTALLRKCNYEVVNAANGLQAWKILEDLNNHIDIVMTEVVMPCLSGIDLLCNIMSHKTRKNIPVIMMSSHDSMGLVFKCLSKGAVDFLVKPIRKNELKNLWQHVWRRCHSSSGSASESGTHTQNSVKSKGSNKSDSRASDDRENDASNGLNAGDGSDDGSGAQSSWTKQAVEVDSSQALFPMDQVDDCRTFAPGTCSNAQHPDYKYNKYTLEKGNDLDIIVHKNLVSKSENPGEKHANPTGRESESTREVANKLDININATDGCKEPNLELSLKRLRGGIQDERYVLRRSGQSAFSRYNTSTKYFKSPNAITGSSSMLDNSNEDAKRESVGDIQVFLSDRIAYQTSNEVISNNIDMGSTTNKLPKSKSEATLAIDGLHPSAFRPVKNDHRCIQQQVSLVPNRFLCRENSSDQDLKAHQNSHHHHHNFHKIENQPLSNYDESSVKQLFFDALHCGSTNILGGPMNGNNLRNSNLYRSASGSNCGSNKQNGDNNAESDVGQAGKSRSGDASGSVCGNKADKIRFAQREAALIKFRQKRMERCFSKKVRYQARKKLAEQRTRVRGQFAKQSGTDSSNRSEMNNFSLPP